MKSTWKPHEKHGGLSGKDKRELPETVFAFPGERKEPMTDAGHVRNAIARFDQVQGVTDEDRNLAFQNILAAAALRRRRGGDGLASTRSTAAHTESRPLREVGPFGVAPDRSAVRG
ncbi:DUF6582 domain-containing protein [Micromonospora sp. M12]